MGIRNIWHMDLSRVFGQTPWFGCPPVIRQIHNHGQVERHRTGKDESWRKPKRQKVFRISVGLGRHAEHPAEIQH